MNTVNPVIRPSSSAARRWPLAAVWCLVAIAFLALGHTVAAVAALAGVVVFAFGALSRTRTMIRVDVGQASFRNVWGRTRPLPSGVEGGRVVAVVISGLKGSAHWLWLSGSGDCQAALNLAAWDVEELDDLRISLEVPLDAEPTPVALRDAPSRYPGVVPKWMANRWFLTALSR